MPKTRDKTGAYFRKKFKLGGRKSTVSAESLSQEELKNKLVNPSFGKDKIKILQVLDSRN